ncbi:hypothetical protein FA15DRAFT_648522 [Coprinopsis marcescibilis]|uniref:G domain-containing protein n=1 Tax=Coprinopsis marcescibilis TaxID=230819 RepID=A0A5C3KH75_COPMA|nr:hypothetical protein FA15DRAFT_648522 [Coprinopsis marcescibilis]
MGITGAGRSSFINAFGGGAKVGEGLESSTRDICMYIIRLPDELASEYPDLKSRRVALVDTPGFDGTSVVDLEIFARITEWVKNQYTRGVTVGGVIYMCDIGKGRVNGAARVNVERFAKLLGGSNAFRRVVLVTTAWDGVELDKGAKREQELCSSFWKELIDGGAVVRRTKDLAGPRKPSGHVDVLRHILQCLST